MSIYYNSLLMCVLIYKCVKKQLQKFVSYYFLFLKDQFNISVYPIGNQKRPWQQPLATGNGGLRNIFEDLRQILPIFNVRKSKLSCWWAFLQYVFSKTFEIVFSFDVKDNNLILCSPNIRLSYNVIEMIQCFDILFHYIAKMHNVRNNCNILIHLPLTARYLNKSRHIFKNSILKLSSVGFEKEIQN